MLQIFIVCNFQPDKNSPDVAVNDEHAMMRFEFLEAIVRLGEHCLGRVWHCSWVEVHGAHPKRSWSGVFPSPSCTRLQASTVQKCTH